MKLLGGYSINFEEDQIILGKDVIGSLSAFKEYAKENYPDIVKKHRIKSILDRVDSSGIHQHDIVNWVEVIDEVYNSEE